MTGRRGRVQRVSGAARRAALSFGLVLAGAAPALAEATSELLFSHKAWEVSVVGFDDGSVSCMAQVTDGSRSFSLWSDQSRLVRLQFYDDSWDLGEGDTADLEVQIDRRAPWTLTNAELYLQSVLFDIPDSGDGVSFMNEVMRGNVLYLNDADGNPVESYSLAGSSAAIGALVECVEAPNADSNPFN